MQVLPCSKRFCHDWTVCPYAHPGEKAKRRDPRVHSYTGIACPNMKKVSLTFTLQSSACMYACMSSKPPYTSWHCRTSVLTIQPRSVQDQACVRGDNCPYAHNVFEYWLHPTRYRTQLCNDMEKCNRKVGLTYRIQIYCTNEHAFRSAAMRC